MTELRNELAIDASGLNQEQRLEILKTVRRVGGTVLHEDTVHFIESAEPVKPVKKLIRDLETDLASRDPFSLIICGFYPGCSAKLKVNPNHVDSVFERVRYRGLHRNATSNGLSILSRMGDDWMTDERKRPAAEALGITKHSGPGYKALTLHDPTRVTENTLRDYCVSVGQAGAIAALTILVEMSSTVTNSPQ